MPRRISRPGSGVAVGEGAKVGVGMGVEVGVEVPTTVTVPAGFTAAGPEQETTNRNRKRTGRERDMLELTENATGLFL
jgi:hypothetical protein